ncbi:hypothetical protein LOTGIDRAFT_162046 [Lottia gigantea]|uniref:Uncharacterized protein n=1 Tax=Lottia gigantea TaxID=225164 RepID=V4A8G3_LOTGI|nr:hypothetical protein LOTGIDRAFT_162046 [Lottia gigantea]ESO93022.1 hypothetical protein LOTGIDRAFT_162046 [Lottia gigantea]
MAEGGDVVIDDLVGQFQAMLSNLSPGNRERVLLSLVSSESEVKFQSSVPAFCPKPSTGDTTKDVSFEQWRLEILGLQTENLYTEVSILNAARRAARGTAAELLFRPTIWRDLVCRVVDDEAIFSCTKRYGNNFHMGC